MTKLIFEKSEQGRRGCLLPEAGVPEIDPDSAIDSSLLNEEEICLPETSELEIMRHYVELSNKNHCIEKGFYPLGSCTMKYNPKVNESICQLPRFKDLHPYLPVTFVQGTLELMYELQNFFAEITGMDKVSLQPAAGSHGEFTGMLIVKAYFKNKGEERTKVIVPDSAHGTNPASAKMCGYEILEVKSNDKGQVDIEKLEELVDDKVAAIMLTNPNTLGIFEENIQKIAEIMHKAGALLYYDGANLNAIMGIVKPGDMGFDIVHINTHKTFSTPHGGGGPGSGPVAVKDYLSDFLPVPTIDFDGESFFLKYDTPLTIGKVRSFYGNVGVLLRAYTYVLAMGKNGLKQVSMDAVLNANYLKEKLKTKFFLPYEGLCMHEFVLSGKIQKEQGVNTLGIAKRMMDFGIHPPTIYFPLIVPEAMMIEPTETESNEILDNFIEIMEQIAKEIEENPEEVLKSPHNTPVKKIDEVLAAKKPNVAYKKQ
ncbi:MAG: aminomethyl-transferring glycine dehydrogenase subunit GcvPB [Cyanobacteriota bacterium]